MYPLTPRRMMSSACAFRHAFEFQRERSAGHAIAVDDPGAAKPRPLRENRPDRDVLRVQRHAPVRNLQPQRLLSDARRGAQPTSDERERENAE